MTPAEHIARAEALLDAWATPDTLTEAAVLAVAHAAVAFVRHEAGLWDGEAAPPPATGSRPKWIDPMGDE